MNKDKLSSWTLVIAVIMTIGGAIQISSPEYEPDLLKAILTFCIGIAFAVITWRLRVAVRREREAAAEAQKKNCNDDMPES